MKFSSVLHTPHHAFLLHLAISQDTTVKYYPSSSDLVNGSTQSSVVPHHQQPKVVIEVSPTTTHSCPTNHLLGSATPSATSSSFSRPSAADVTSVSDRSPSPPTLPTTLSAKPDAVTAVKRVRTISQHSLAEDSPDASPEHVRSEREPLLEAVPSSRKCCKYRENIGSGLLPYQYLERCFKGVGS